MRKYATLTGPLAAVALLGGLFEDNVATSRPDGAIRAWLSTSGSAGWLVHAVAIACGGVLLVAYAHVLRDRLAPVGDPRDPVPTTTLPRLVGTLGGVLGTMVLVGAALFAAVPIGRVFEQAPLPDPTTYRYLMAASASVLVIFVSLPAAALAASTSIVGLRRGTMPRWLGYAGLVLAALVLVSSFVMPLMVFGLWLVLSGVALAVTSAEGSVGPRVPADLAQRPVARAR